MKRDPGLRYVPVSDLVALGGRAGLTALGVYVALQNVQTEKQRTGKSFSAMRKKIAGRIGVGNLNTITKAMELLEKARLITYEVRDVRDEKTRAITHKFYRVKIVGTPLFLNGAMSTQSVSMAPTYEKSAKKGKKLGAMNAESASTAKAKSASMGFTYEKQSHGCTNNSEIEAKSASILSKERASTLSGDAVLASPDGGAHSISLRDAGKTAYTIEQLNTYQKQMEELEDIENCSKKQEALYEELYSIHSELQDEWEKACKEFETFFENKNPLTEEEKKLSNDLYNLVQRATILWDKYPHMFTNNWNPACVECREYGYQLRELNPSAAKTEAELLAVSEYKLITDKVRVPSPSKVRWNNAWRTMESIEIKLLGHAIDMSLSKMTDFYIAARAIREAIALPNPTNTPPITD